MTTKINSDTSDGLKITSDTSGVLDIQSAGTTKMTVGTTIDVQGNELVLDADADTSIHASTDDQIDFKTGGTDRMVIDSAGKVGIGTTSPAHMLHVKASDSRVRTEETGGSTTFDMTNTSGGHFLDSSGTNDLTINKSGSANLVFKTANSERVRIDASGNVYFGTTSSAPWTATSGTFARIGDTFPLTTTNAGINAIFNRNTSTGTLVEYKQASNVVGSVSVTASNTAYNTSSDYRLKENVDYSFDATARLKQLKPCRFNWIIDETNTAVDGFIAHEVSSIVPEAITGTKDATKDVGTIKDSDGNVITENVVESAKEDGQTWVKTATENVYQGIDQSKLVPLLVKTIQELEARITALESE